MRLGRSGNAWAFLPVAAQVLRVAPRDQLVRVLTASNLAAIGLGTPAREFLAGLGEAARADPDVVSLSEKIEQLPGDQIEPSQLIATCKANLEAIGGAASGLSGDPSYGLPGSLAEAEADWVSRVGSVQWLKACDGNVIRRDKGSLDLASWTGLGDQVGAADVFSNDYFGTETDTHGPLTIEGMDPPWILLKALGVFAEQADGYVRRIRVVQADPIEMLDGLAQADLTEPLSSGQIELFAGDGCGERFRERLLGSMACLIRGPYVPLATLRTKVEPSLQRHINNVCSLQEIRQEALSEDLARRYADRDIAWWRLRYRDATTGGEPLRVLVTTCLFSTFVQHSSRDMVGAIRRTGHDAQLLIEPNHSMHMCSVAYLEKILEYDPDMVVLINYTRQNMGHAFPARLPFVTWIQDAMPHLFDARVGSAMGAFDFLAGHLLEELFSKFDYPMTRLIPSPVVADSHKFHPGAVSERLRDEHACEIAFVSHHSETPEQMHVRLRDECSDEPRLVRVVEELYEEIREAAAVSGREFMFIRLRELAERKLVCEMGEDASPGNRARLLRMYCMPMADRLIRHETLRWAVELAQKHGWRLHLYGRGWERNDEFCRYAGGELAHGEGLRAAYQCAAVHLHMSAHTLVHQRVMECALSGGLPLCRLMLDQLGSVRGWAHRAAASRCEPTGHNAVWDVPEFVIAEHAELMSVAAQYQRLGLAYRDVGALSIERLKATREQAARDVSRHNPAWLLGDLAETTFRSRDDLERLVTRAIARPRWRENIVQGIAGRVTKETTHDAFFARVVNCINDSFSERHS